jgi:hypothetical protein
MGDPFQREPSISLRKATDLVDTGEWSFDSTIRKIISEESILGLKNLESHGLLRLRGERASLEEHETAAQLADDLLGESFERFFIRYPSDPRSFLTSEIRVQEHAVIKIFPTMHEAFFKILGIIVAVYTTTNIKDTVGYVAVGLSLRDFCNVIVKAWERLTKPSEKIVFEAVFALHGKLSVVNENAFERERFDEAFGYLWPFEEDIVAYCAPQPQSDTVDALQRLKERKILGVKDARWYIEV